MHELGSASAAPGTLEGNHASVRPARTAFIGRTLLHAIARQKNSDGEAGLPIARASRAAVPGIAPVRIKLESLTLDKEHILVGLSFGKRQEARISYFFGERKKQRKPLQK